MKFSMFCVLFQALFRYAERFISYHRCRTLSTTFFNFFQKFSFRFLQRLSVPCSPLLWTSILTYVSVRFTRQLYQYTKDTSFRQALFSNLLQKNIQLRIQTIRTILSALQSIRASLLQHKATRTFARDFLFYTLIRNSKTSGWTNTKITDIL